MKAILLAAIRAYQYLLSPWVGGACRFWPTCSEYAGEAIERHGALRGSWMMLARLARCHPRGSGGVDPVPEQFRWRCWQCSTRAARVDATAQPEAPCVQPVPSIPPMPTMATRREPR